MAGQDFGLLSDEDLAAVAEGMPAESSALVVVWENVWAARLAAAVRGSHGQVATLQRVPRETVTATAVSRRVQSRADQRDAERYAAEPPPPPPAAAPAPAPAPAPADATESRVDQLRTPADLKAQGVLSDEEFAAEKARILNS